MSLVRKCVVGECIWSDQTLFCEVLGNASVPLDGKWPLVILYLRGIRDTSFLSEVQKSEMQETLLQILEKKDFSEERYEAVQQRILTIITENYTKKITEIARETSELAKDMQSMFGKHCQGVSAVAEKVDAGLARGANPAVLLADLRDTLKGVVAKMEDDVCVLAELSHKDCLTGLANRRAFDAFLEEAVESWAGTGEAVSLILMDIDRFKTFNDTFGHPVGDQVLRTLASQILKIVAPLTGDPPAILAARYGGEEFAVVLRGEVAPRAVALAEVIRKTVQKTALRVRNAESKVVQSGLRVTVSIGVASLWAGWPGAYLSNLVDSADKALYQAKHQGRNCTVRFLPDSDEPYAPVEAETSVPRPAPFPADLTGRSPEAASDLKGIFGE
jgi:diguanylate cyclase (GGDEF)-like protein